MMTPGPPPRVIESPGFLRHMWRRRSPPGPVSLSFLVFWGAWAALVALVAALLGQPELLAQSTSVLALGASIYGLVLVGVLVWMASETTRVRRILRHGEAERVIVTRVERSPEYSFLPFAEIRRPDSQREIRLSGARGVAVDDALVVLVDGRLEHNTVVPADLDGVRFQGMDAGAEGDATDIGPDAEGGLLELAHAPPRDAEGEVVFGAQKLRWSADGFVLEGEASSTPLNPGAVQLSIQDDAEGGRRWLHAQLRPDELAPVRLSAPLPSGIEARGVPRLDAPGEAVSWPELLAVVRAALHADWVLAHARPPRSVGGGAQEESDAAPEAPRRDGPGAWWRPLVAPRSVWTLIPFTAGLIAIAIVLVTQVSTRVAATWTVAAFTMGALLHRRSSQRELTGVPVIATGSMWAVFWALWFVLLSDSYGSMEDWSAHALVLSGAHVLVLYIIMVIHEREIPWVPLLGAPILLAVVKIGFQLTLGLFVLIGILPPAALEPGAVSMMVLFGFAYGALAAAYVHEVWGPSPARAGGR